MEPIEFLVICNDEKYLKQTVDWYNTAYKTDFTIVKMLHDEVNFAMLRVSKFKYEDIFSIGYQFGVKEQILREKGKIDW
jgi:hypothetical protein